MKESLMDLSNSFGLLVLWLAEIVINRQYKPLDVFLYDQGYIPMGRGVWIKREELRK